MMVDFILLQSGDVPAIRDGTASNVYRLEPVQVAAGSYAGAFVLPSRVLTDPAFSAYHDQLAACEIVSLDVDTAFAAPGDMP